jgi:pimeloyl-ACP methyl ester carboxylesterase
MIVNALDIVACCVFCIGIIGGAVHHVHHRFVYRGHYIARSSSTSISGSDAWVLSADGECIVHTRILPATTVDQRRRLILYCHGNTGTIDTWAVQSLRAYGDVCVFDYRGYGRSSDRSPSLDGILADGEGALRHCLLTHTYEEITVYGRSLGASVACYLAALPDLSVNVTRLVLEVPLVSTIGEAWYWRAMAWLIALPTMDIVPIARNVSNGVLRYAAFATRDEVVSRTASRRLSRRVHFDSILHVECAHADVGRSAHYQTWLSDDVFSEQV